MTSLPMPLTALWSSPLPRQADSSPPMASMKARAQQRRTFRVTAYRTLANGAAWTTGKNSNGVTFDGLDKGALSQKITLPSTLDITALPFTLEAWVKPVDFADWRAYFSKRSAYAPNQMRFDAGLQISTGLVYVTTSSSTSTFAYAPQ